MWFLNLIFLKLKGVKIHYSAKVSPKARILVRSGSVTIGKRTYIHDYVLVDTFDGEIVIGENVSINPFSILYGHGSLTIGSNTRIATSCVIVASNHNYLDMSVLVKDQGVSKQGIKISDDVWLGAHVVVLDGINIEIGSIIGASSVVTKSTIPYGVYVGNPAKYLRSRQ